MRSFHISIYLRIWFSVIKLFPFLFQLNAKELYFKLKIGNEFDCAMANKYVY